MEGNMEVEIGHLPEVGLLGRGFCCAICAICATVVVIVVVIFMADETMYLGVYSDGLYDKRNLGCIMYFHPP